MPKLEVKENKILKLTNVLSRKTADKEVFNSDKQMRMIQNWIKVKGYKSKGPLIVYSSGVKGAEANGSPIIDNRLLVQLDNEKITAEYPYKFEQLIRLEKCLFVRFDDNFKKMQFAVNGIHFFAYNNDIELTGESYTVLIEDYHNGNILADVFMPVKHKIEIANE
ncbi:MAG: hypothetical protein LBU60_00630 [Clostridiales bacterium]|jgi:hypothetical protein|nr:hypothetical protein [Clostridiales bacterium]